MFGAQFRPERGRQTLIGHLLIRCVCVWERVGEVGGGGGGGWGGGSC